MSETLAQRVLAELLADLENNRLVLPTLPEVALRVRDALDNDDASVGQIAKVIATDAALTARLIQVANSPLLRGNREFDTLEAAVTRMGLTMTRNMVTSMVMEQMFQATADATDKRLRAVWEHSTEVAAISHAMASQFTRLRPEQAMLGGLVHDIGALPILSRAEEIPELLADEAALDEVIAAGHGPLGRAILQHWHFPPELVEVADQHENLSYDSAPGPDYVDVVIVANLQSHIGTDHPLASADWSQIPAFAKLGLSHDVNVVDLDETGEEIAAVKGLLAG